MAEFAELDLAQDSDMSLIAAQAANVSLGPLVSDRVGHQLTRMFRDPHVLNKEERLQLIHDLEQCIELAPGSVDIRVLLGMTQCVDLQVQQGLTTLRDAVAKRPDSFLARLKLGELLMRLRICDQAMEQTEQAAQLASNAVQSELARRQAAALRVMMREGIERGGYNKVLKGISGFWRRFDRRAQTPQTDVALAGQQ